MGVKRRTKQEILDIMKKQKENNVIAKQMAEKEVEEIKQVSLLIKDEVNIINCSKNITKEKLSIIINELMGYIIYVKEKDMEFTNFENLIVPLIIKHCTDIIGYDRKELITYQSDVDYIEYSFNNLIMTTVAFMDIYEGTESLNVVEYLLNCLEGEEISKVYKEIKKINKDIPKLIKTLETQKEALKATNEIIDKYGDKIAHGMVINNIYKSDK